MSTEGQKAFSANATGFEIKFDNGYSVSVRWGTGNYAANRFKDYDTAIFGSDTAEVAVFDHLDGFVPFTGSTGNVEGWCSPTRVIQIMNEVRAWPESGSKNPLVGFEFGDRVIMIKDEGCFLKEGCIGIVRTVYDNGMIDIEPEDIEENAGLYRAFPDSLYAWTTLAECVAPYNK